MNEIANALRSLLAQNIVFFTYRKVNGEIRHAKGTRNLDVARNHTGEYIPNPKGAEQPHSYYDVEKMGWRSYKPENLISIDGVLPRTDTEFAKKPTLPNEPPKETKKPELPKREIPVSKPAEKSTANIDINDFLGGIFGGFGMPMDEIKKSMEDFGKDIFVGNPLAKDIIVGNPPYDKLTSTPTPAKKDMTLSLNEISVEDFAKMVAHYAVEEFVSRLTR